MKEVGRSCFKEHIFDLFLYLYICVDDRDERPESCTVNEKMHKERFQLLTRNYNCAFYQVSHLFH